jgi:hypothetical protein
MTIPTVSPGWIRTITAPAIAARITRSTGKYSDLAGSWLSPDPYSGSYDFTNPQSLNRYSYVMNNPAALNDPSGLNTQCATTTVTVDGTTIQTSAENCITKDDDDGPVWYNPLSWFSGWGGHRHIYTGPRPSTPQGAPNKMNCGTITSNVATTQNEIKNQGRLQALSNFASRSWPTGSYNPFAAFSTIGLNDQSSWDYKFAYGAPGVSFGNVNYGANCAQFGLGKYGCGSFAGGATMINSANHLPQGQGVPFVNYPYGKQTDSANMPSVMGGVDIGKGGTCQGW